MRSCCNTMILWVCVVWAMAAPGCARSDQSLKRVADGYWNALMERSPTWATSVGDYRFNDRLTDVSEAARRQWQQTLRTLLADVRRLRVEGLTAEDSLTRDLLERAIRDRLAKIDCHLEYTPLDPLSGPHISFPLILVSQPFRNVGDFEDYVARLRAFPKQIDDHIDNMLAGMAVGFVSPRVTMEKVLPQVWTHVVKDVTQSALYAPVEKATMLSDADQEAVVARITDAIMHQVVPAYRKLGTFLENEYIPACRLAVGIGSVPDGERIYETLAYLNTTVHVSPEKIHQIGLAEVGRIRREMDKVQKEAGFEGTLDDFLTHMRTDPRYRFTSGEELYAAADAILQRTKPLLPKLFGRIPKADCVMKEIESFRAASSPVAYYNPAPEDGSRPGYYYINTYAPKERLRFTLEALSYHEAVPGHHFQMALDQENQRLPKFRRYGSFTAYVEGWALYTEKLGYEIGGYSDPYMRFGQLTFEMWRACRLVVDTGLHAKGWSRQRAIDFMAANTSLALIDIGAEVDRYISWPGQALAYKMGELRIVNLRQEAEQTLGDKFDVRAFHDALLSGGAMPINMLETRMRAWISTQSR